MLATHSLYKGMEPLRTGNTNPRHIGALRILFSLLFLWGMSKSPSFMAPDYFLSVKSISSYNPDSLLLQLLFASSPTLDTLLILKYTLFSLLLLSICGLFSRFTFGTSLLLSIVFSALDESYWPGWCHFANFLYIPAFPLVFAKGLGHFSITEYFSEKSKEEHDKVQNVSAWPIRLAVFGVAIGLFDAGTFKLLQGGLEWALSDNVRNHILRDLILLRNDPTWIQSVTIASPFMFKSFGILNFVAQLFPILAFVFFKSMKIRIIASVLVCAEFLFGISVVMGLCNYGQALLALLFFPFELLKLTSGPRTLPSPQSLLNNVFLTGGTLVFMAIPVWLLFSAEGTDYKFKTFPFSKFSMHGTLLANPDSEYVLTGTDVKLQCVNSKREDTQTIETLIQRSFYPIGYAELNRDSFETYEASIKKYFFYLLKQYKIAQEDCNLQVNRSLFKIPNSSAKSSTVSKLKDLTLLEFYRGTWNNYYFDLSYDYNSRFELKFCSPVSLDLSSFVECSSTTGECLPAKISIENGRFFWTKEKNHVMMIGIKKGGQKESLFTGSMR